MLFFNTSKIQFERKSQHTLEEAKEWLCCFSIRQRYNLKANHNCGHRNTYFSLLFFNTSKIQFESKSQHKNIHINLKRRCFSIRQRYNLKANHNWQMQMQCKFDVVFQYVKDTI